MESWRPSPRAKASLEVQGGSRRWLLCVEQISSLLVSAQSINPPETVADLDPIPLPGSYDGSIRLWNINTGLKSFSPLFDIPAHGFVNALQILAIPSGVYETGLTTTSADVVDVPSAEKRARAKAQPDLLLVAALAKEPRLGRWSRVTGDGTKNGTLIVQLKRGDTTAVLE